jgi:GNAT superfamily N-acetyltransferase
MSITVRQAKPEDAPLIAQYNAFMALETENRILDHEILRKGVESVLANPALGLYYVAEVNGRTAGQLMITYEWSDWRNGTFWWIQSVYVREEFRGKGVFKALYRYVEAQARLRSDVCGLRLYVENGNERAKRTYEKLGMNRTSYELYERDFVFGKGSS